jgi:hypothetical protein
MESVDAPYVGCSLSNCLCMVMVLLIEEQNSLKMGGRKRSTAVGKGVCVVNSGWLEIEQTSVIGSGAGTINRYDTDV